MVVDEGTVGGMAAHPRRHPALVVVDVQEDFCEGGSLAVRGANSVANQIAAYVGASMLGAAPMYELVALTRDYHEPGSDNGGHFVAESEEPDLVKTWPRHCVQGTSGADLHRSVRDVARRVVDAMPGRLVIVHKGQGLPAYSGFEGVTTEGPGGQTLLEVLNNAGVTQVDVVGIATDYCVRATALDAATYGFDTRVLLGMCAAVAEESAVAAVEEMREVGVEVAGL